MYFKSISLSLAVTGLLLAGCSSTDKPTAPTASTPTAEASTSAAAPSFSGTCDAAAVATLVGKTANTALVEQAKRQSGAETARILRPHDAVTMDYNSRRLNIDVSETDVVKQFTCG
ncbi:I78 family peptidase inhibitor [Pseudomonas sp. OTU5201]|uniref:I78 family peptidase inhibitor n=1 Tax=Pseudomonas sp. OTU5201 TaxID=3043850 RepID=UPI00313B3382